MKHWTIVGAGALGCTFAALLSRNGNEVSLLMRDQYRGRFHPSVEFTDLKGHTELVHTDRLFASSVARDSIIDIVLVTTKVHQVVEALAPLVNRLNREVPILLLHNGMGPVDLIQQMFPKHPLLQGSTAHGAQRIDYLRSCHMGAGETYIGAVNDKGREWKEPVCQGLEAALSQVTWSDEISLQLWNKLAINCIINPLTALHRCRNGELLGSRFGDTLEQLYDELEEVMRLEGVAISREELKRNVIRVIESTADNYSSMNRDLHLHQPSEIEHINGFVLRCADHHGVPAPVNNQLYRDIKAKESSYA